MGNAIYSVFATVKTIATPIKPPSFLKQQSHMQEEQKSIKPDKGLWMKQCCLWGKKKFYLFTHQHRTPLFPIPISSKEKKASHTGSKEQNYIIVFKKIKI